MLSISMAEKCFEKAIFESRKNPRMKIQFSPRVFSKNTLNGLVKIEFSYEDSESVEGF